MGEEPRSLVERLVVLETIVHEMRSDLAEVLARFDGPPWERSVRGRLHTLEAESTAAKAAAIALSEAQAQRRMARGELAEAYRYRLSWRWKLAGAVTAAIVAAAPYVTLFYGRR